MRHREETPALHYPLFGEIFNHTQALKAKDVVEVIKISINCILSNLRIMRTRDCHSQAAGIHLLSGETTICKVTGIAARLRDFIRSTE